MSFIHKLPAAIVKNRAVTANLLKVQRQSPAILFGVGVVGVVGTVVMASKATLQLNDILEDTSVNLNKANTLDHPDYSPEDRVKDKVVIYAQASMKISKLYLPAFCIGVVSIGALTGSHQILSRRNVALTAAYAGAEKSLREYRGRVIDAIGADKESKIWQPVEMVDAVDADGKKIKAPVPTAAGGSPYKVLFAEHNPHWNNLAEYNQIFLQAQQNYANDLLRSHGHVFLNDVHEMLGLPRTKAGQIVGWVWNGDGDNYIDFGIFADAYEGKRFASGMQNNVWLDFNVDGNVLDILD